MKRKIAAILAADIAGYSKLVAEDEEETLRRLASYRAVFDDFIAKASGRIFNTAGDAVLAEFASAVEAVRCAIDIQESLRTRNLAYPPSRQMSFRIGITIGDVVERDGDLLGDGVNIAARLEGLAPAGGICVSRAVHEQVSNKLSVQFDDIGEQAVKNIPTPVHAFMVQLRKDDGLKEPLRQGKSAKPAPRKWSVAAALTGTGAVAIAASVYLVMTLAPQGDSISMPPTAPRQQSPPPPTQRQAEVLVPETVPAISDRDRARIRTLYLPAPDYKALAISSGQIGLSTEQRDEETAKRAALEACLRGSDQSRRSVKCEMYAVGNVVVWKRGSPPMPPSPWVVRDPSIEKPFSAAAVPLVNLGSRRFIDENYLKSKASKALALSPSGVNVYFSDIPSVDEAVRRALESCGLAEGIACMIFAVDNVFVVPIPASMKIAGFLRPGLLGAVAPEIRDDVVRRVENATSGWRAIAAGAAGRPGVMLGAATEQAAIDGALADCAKQDRACRVVAIGPFLVEPLPTTTSPAAVAPPAAPASPVPLSVGSGALKEMLVRNAPNVTATAHDETVRLYEASSANKALAIVLGTDRRWYNSGMPTREVAEERALEACQVVHQQLCALVAVNDQLQATAGDGKLQTRDMPRVHYASSFDPAQIPAVLPSLRQRPDINAYRNAAAPKAVAYHPGSGGRVFLVTVAATQRAAEERALEVCNSDPQRAGRDGPCFLYAVGDQVVLPQRRTAPMTVP